MKDLEINTGNSLLFADALSSLHSLPRDVLDLTLNLQREIAGSDEIIMPEVVCKVNVSGDYERAWADACKGGFSIISWDAVERVLSLRDRQGHAWRLCWHEPYRGTEDWWVQSLKKDDGDGHEIIQLNGVTYSPPSPHAVISPSSSPDPVVHFSTLVYRGLRLPTSLVTLPSLAISVEKKIRNHEGAEELMSLITPNATLELCCMVYFEGDRSKYLHGICLHQDYALVFASYWIGDGKNIWMINEVCKSSPKDALLRLSHSISVPHHSKPCSLRIRRVLNRFGDISDEIAEANFAKMLGTRPTTKSTGHDQRVYSPQLKLNLCNATENWRCPTWMNGRLPKVSQRPLNIPSEVSAKMLLKRLNMGEVSIVGLPKWIDDDRNVIQMTLRVDSWILTVSSFPWPEKNDHRRGWVAERLSKQPIAEAKEPILRWETPPKSGRILKKRVGHPNDADEARSATSSINRFGTSLEACVSRLHRLDSLKHQLKSRLDPGKEILQRQIDMWKRLCELELTFLDGEWDRNESSHLLNNDRQLSFTLTKTGKQNFKKWFNDFKDNIKTQCKRDHIKLKSEETWAERAKSVLLEDKPWHKFQLWTGRNEEVKLSLRDWVDENGLRTLLFSTTRRDRLDKSKATDSHSAWMLSAPSNDSQVDKYKQAIHLLQAHLNSQVDQDYTDFAEERETDTSFGAQSLCRAISKDVEPIILTQAPIAWNNPHLSQAQQRAVRTALESPDFSLIQGPPGTGKTTVILELVTQLFMRAQGKVKPKILMVAPTHIAVDNLLERLVTPRTDGEMSLAERFGIFPIRYSSDVDKIQTDLRGYHDQSYGGEDFDRMKRGVDSDLQRRIANQALQKRQFELLHQGYNEDWARLTDDHGIPLPLESLAEAQLSEITERVRLWRNRSEIKESTALVDLLSQWSEYIQESKQDFNQKLQKYGNLFMCTTVLGGVPKEVRDQHFDMVIMDEAGKEESRRVLVPLTSAKRWVLVGDHKQLPPFVDETLAKRASVEGFTRNQLERSLFESLIEISEQSHRRTFLDRQGRMHPQISDFVSKNFYKGELGNFVNVSKYEVYQGKAWPRHALSLIDTRTHKEKREYNNRDGIVSNHLEVRIVFSLLKRLQRENGSPYESIGVICPYRSQLDLLTRELHSVKKRDEGEPLLYAFWERVHLGTIDGFQGQEKSLVIFTATRSNPYGSLGFTDHEQRLNVAFSRARQQLIVILDSETVEIAEQRAKKSTDYLPVSGMERMEQRNRSVFTALLNHVDKLGSRVSWDKAFLEDRL